MKYHECIAQLRKLLNATEPAPSVSDTDAIAKFAAACALVDWTTRGDKKAREQFSVFLSYYEIYALHLDGYEEITLNACEKELAKLSMHVPTE